MKRTINHTNRTKILREDAVISLRMADHGKFGLDAVLNLSGYDFPVDASVFVEAYRRTVWMRFPWGTVGDCKPQGSLMLTDFDTPDEVQFRVKVVASGKRGLLLGEAEGLSPASLANDRSDRTPLLPVKPQNLGDEIWRLEFEDDRVRLLINSGVEDVVAVAHSPMFRSLVYPAALRTILDEALCRRELEDQSLPVDPEEGSWQWRWVRFGMQVNGISPLTDPFEMDDENERTDWIDDVVGAFCRQLKAKDLFALAVSGERK
jgi:hypothetical protein